MPPAGARVVHPVCEPQTLGLYKDDLDIFVNEAREVFRKSWGPELNKTIDELEKRQDELPIQLTLEEMERLSARYCGALRKSSGHLANELAEAAANRIGLGKRQKEVIEEYAKRFIRERTSPEAANDLFAGAVTRLFTIGNAQQSEQFLAQSLAELAGSGLLISDAVKAVKLAAAKYGDGRVVKKSHQNIPAKLPPKKRDLSRYFDDADLTERQRETISLRLEYGLSVAAIARMKGVHRKTVQESIAAAKVRIDRASNHVRSASTRAKVQHGESF